VTVQWTAVGDDSLTGTATSYDLRMSTSAITAANFSSATALTGEPTPAAPGTLQSVTVRGLSRQVTYWFAIKGHGRCRQCFGDLERAVGHDPGHDASCRHHEPLAGARVDELLERCGAAPAEVAWQVAPDDIRAHPRKNATVALVGTQGGRADHRPDGILLVLAPALARAQSPDSLVLTWTAPSDPGAGAVSRYDARYATTLITSANFASAT